MRWSTRRWWTRCAGRAAPASGLQAKTLLADGGVAATYTGRYVAIGKA